MDTIMETIIPLFDPAELTTPRIRARYYATYREKPTFELDYHARRLHEYVARTETWRNGHQRDTLVRVEAELRRRARGSAV